MNAEEIYKPGVACDTCGWRHDGECPPPDKHRSWEQRAREAERVIAEMRLTTLAAHEKTAALRRVADAAQAVLCELPGFGTDPRPVLLERFAKRLEAALEELRTVSRPRGAP